MESVEHSNLFLQESCVELLLTRISGEMGPGVWKTSILLVVSVD
jgi:hypothetical protein